MNAVDHIRGCRKLDVACERDCYSEQAGGEVMAESERGMNAERPSVDRRAFLRPFLHPGDATERALAAVAALTSAELG
jgi:hypothetical protein